MLTYYIYPLNGQFREIGYEAAALLSLSNIRGRRAYAAAAELSGFDTRGRWGQCCELVADNS